MKRSAKGTLQAVMLSLAAAEVLAVGQGADVARVLSEVRAALGGEDRLAAVKTLAIEGQSARPSPDGTSAVRSFEMAIELPDKFMKRDAIASMGGASITRRSGFNGADLIEEIDAPPAMGGAVHMIRMGPSGMMPGGQATPEQIDAQRAQSLASARREFARLTLGMFAASFPVHPLEFSYGGVAESPDGKADIVDVKGTDGFAARLFVDSRTRLPLMLSWMDKEPLRMTMGGPGAGGQAVVSATSREDVEKLQREVAESMKQAEASRRTVEYRIFYGDYRSFGGIKLPTRIQRMTDGEPTEELTFDEIRVNTKIDPAKFSVIK